MHHSALFLAALSILAGIPTAPLTPFLCMDNAGHSSLELGNGSIVDGPDTPGNRDEGDLSPSDDPPGNQPNRCHDVRLDIQVGSPPLGQHAAAGTPQVIAMHLAPIDEPALSPALDNSCVLPPTYESPPGSARFHPLRI